MKKPKFNEKLLTLNKKEIENILSDVKQVENSHERSNLERSIESVDLNTSYPRKREIKS